MEQSIDKVLRMRARHKLHTQMMHRENQMCLCTIAMKAREEEGLCQCDLCKKNRAEVKLIKERIQKLYPDT